MEKKWNKKNIKIRKNDTVGRYVVAAKNLKSGDYIFEELPFAYGPKSNNPAVCLGCHNRIDDSTFCSSCGWPVCNATCEKLKCHKDAECGIFSKAGVKFQLMEDTKAICLQYECITPLRVLIAKENNPERWNEEIKIMESHDDLRKATSVWQFNEINVVSYLRGPCKLYRYPPELIHKICGILEINAFEARTSAANFIRCLYPKLAILSHNCISNIIHSVTCSETGDHEDFRVLVRAATDFKKGEEMYSSYTYSLWPTLVRREFLRESKYFDCKCRRCSDKTELGTHMSTLKCNKCDNGVVMSTNPLDDTCQWKCTQCEFNINVEAVRKVFATIQKEIDAVEMMSDAGGIEARETIFRKYKSVLHPNHAYMTILRAALSQLYGKVDGYAMGDLPDLLLERKVELCTQLLEVLNVIEPGHSRIRGITLYELHSPLLILAKHHYTENLIGKGDFRKKLEEAIDTLKGAADILIKEPESTVEGQLGAVATQAYEQLTTNLEILIKTA